MEYRVITRGTRNHFRVNVAERRAGNKTWQIIERHVFALQEDMLIACRELCKEYKEKGKVTWKHCH